MNNLAEILEDELEEAVEVKNKKSLHRYIALLVENIAQKQETEKQFIELKNEIKILAQTMKQGFENIDKRFEDMNKRFEDMNKRFEDMNKKINLLIWIISLWMSLFTGISVILKFFS